MNLIAKNGVLAATILGEAEGEVYEGKVAVGATVRNRANRRYSSTGVIEEACLRKLQFSCWNPDSPRLERMRTADDSEEVVADCARAAEESGSRDPTGGAVLYYSSASMHEPPPWALKAKFLCQIGNHRFFDDPQ